MPPPLLLWVIVIARNGDVTFGILHSHYGEAWALALGTALEDRPRYTPSTTFETFPFPLGLTPDRPAASYAGNPHARAIAVAQALVTARDRWLNPPELVTCTPEVVPGFPDPLLPRGTAAAKTLRGRTLTALYNTRSTPAGRLAGRAARHSRCCRRHRLRPAGRPARRRGAHPPAGLESQPRRGLTICAEPCLSA